MTGMWRALDMRRSTLALLLLFTVWTQVCYGGGKFELKLKRFQTGCTEHGGASKCDIYFKFCLEKPGVGSCNYLRSQTGVWEDTASIDFSAMSNMKGVANPMVVSVTSFESNTVEFSAALWEEDMITSDDHLDTLRKTFTQTPVLYNLSDNSWQSDYFYKSHHHMWVAYRFYCNADYYTSRCDVYCKAQDSPLYGHYTCDEKTGNKVCMSGWTGATCLDDINECATAPCYNGGNCTNRPGSFQCVCHPHYAGQYCDQIASLCHSSPCKNGGACTGNRENFTCGCTPAWTGHTCEQQVNFCDSNPCHHNATCYGTIGNYTCDCTIGWTGYHCDIEVNACDSSPCKNGATCTKLPLAQYECECPPQYKGDKCESEKDPCAPNLCQNSAVCTKLSYNQYNCTCVAGWTGPACSEYIHVETGAQQGADRKESTSSTVDWWIIFLACCIVVILVCVILAAIFIRRRKQRKADEARLSISSDGNHIVHVASPDNLAFQNAMYIDMNRANSQIDRQRTPVPPTPTDDVFYPVKPKKLPDEEQGAVGGVSNPYADIGDGYLEPVKIVAGADDKEAAGQTKQKLVGGSTGLDTRSDAGASGGKGATHDNHYSDFEELKRRSIAARHNSGSSNPLVNNPQYFDMTGDGVSDPDALQRLQDEEEAHHYHDLDDVVLEIQSAGASASFSANPNRAPAPLSMAPPAATHPEDIDTTDEEDEGVQQEDIAALRRQVLWTASTPNDDSHA